MGIDERKIIKTTPQLIYEDFRIDVKKNTMLKTILNVAKNLFHVENVPLVGEVLEEIKSRDGGTGKFKQINLIRLIRKIARILIILAIAWLTLKGEDEKADKLDKQLKKIEYVQ